MPKIRNLRSAEAGTLIGDIARVKRAVKDLAANVIHVFAAGISVTGGVSTDTLTASGLAQLNGGVNIAGAGITGGLSADTLTVSGSAHLNGGASIAGATITGGAGVTGGLATDSLTASGSATVTGDVTANGQVNSAGSPLMSQPSYGYVVTTSYKATWQDGVTYQFGYSPSTSEVKVGLAAMTAADAAKFLALTPYWGRYVWDDPAAPLKVFFLAEQVQAAGFGADVAPIVEGEPLEMMTPDGLPVIGNDGNPVVIPVGQAYSINYSQLVVPLMALAQAQDARITTLERYVQELATKTGTTLS